MIAIGSDHGGFELKEEIKKYLNELNIPYTDVGPFNDERTDYPIYAEKVAKLIQSGEADNGILCCKSGAGMVIAANKFDGIRATIGFSEDVTRAAKADDNVNVLVLAAWHINVSEAVKIVRTWIATEFKGGRYQERLQMINEIEQREKNRG